MTVEDLDEVGELDIAIDGADQVDPAGWLIKGGGGAHTREKIVAAHARSFVVIASAEKAVAELTAPRSPRAARLRRRKHPAGARPGPSARRSPSPDGGVIADYLGASMTPPRSRPASRPRPASSSTACSSPGCVSLVLIGTGEGVERRTGGAPAGGR